MIDYQRYFNWPDVNIEYFYVYLFLSVLIAAFLVYRSKVKYKIELFFLSFYLLTGNLNKILTFKIPGVSLFEIQPDRFLFFLLIFFIIRKTILSRKKSFLVSTSNIPWFIIALLAFISWSILSVLVNSAEMESGDMLISIHDTVAFLVLLVGLSIMRDKASYDLIGRVIIIGAVISSLVSLIQLTIDPYFLRIGDARLAFADTIRSNGIFSTEYFNSYFLIIAISWVLVTIKRDTLKFLLVILLSMGVLASFQRMSWIILSVVLITYLIYIRKLALEKVLFLGLSGIALILTISILFYQDITHSAMVQERLADSVGGRTGYYELVLDNIDKRPFFGFGDLKNDIYYENILRITSSRERASAESGDLHSGYFSALYLHGVPAFVSFSSFVLLAVFYFAKRYREDLFYVIPFLVSIIYLIGNLTNTFLFLKYISILFAIHIGMAMGIKHLNK